jgi:hypothetical protein
LCRIMRPHDPPASKALPRQIDKSWHAL